MYQANAPRVVHETIEGETVIIDTVSGIYYTALGNASLLWQALAGGGDPRKLQDAYVASGRQRQEFDDFQSGLLDSQLLVPRPEGSITVTAPSFDDSPLPLTLKRYDELQELIELDPIHEIDTAQGWPFRSPESQ